MYGEFANSFLVFAKRNDDTKINFPACIKFNNSPRFRQFSTRIEIYKDKAGKISFQKIARHKESVSHIQAIVENCKILSNIYGKNHVVQAKLLSDDRLEMEYISGDIFEKILCQRLPCTKT